ncbi:hypothetical protein [Agarivorans sp. QJM3NY_25]|uniref:hypothetical protein n=1 Tax=Agarivorans sp. QJM3NY_25 TaxID=3421430 RepID=UPI003D7EC32C
MREDNNSWPTKDFNSSPQAINFKNHEIVCFSKATHRTFARWYSLFHPFKSAHLRHDLSFERLATHAFDSYYVSDIYNRNTEIFTSIITKTYEIFSNQYKYSDLAQDLLANNIQRYILENQDIEPIDFRQNSRVKEKLKSDLSPLKDKMTINNDEINDLMLAIWNAYLKFRIMGKHTEVSHQIYSIEFSEQLTLIPFIPKKTDVW